MHRVSEYGYRTLITPETFSLMPFGGEILRDGMERAGNDILEQDIKSAEGVSVVIRTLNESEKLARLMDSIEQQEGLGETQVIVVDNQSSDDTQKVARSRGAEVVEIPRGEFSYPRSMNVGVEASDFDIVFLTVGYAILASTVAIQTCREEFGDSNKEVGGVYAPPLISVDSSFTEQLLSVGNVFLNRKRVEVTKAGMGVLGATNATIRKSALDAHGGFNESVAMGGEDTLFAKQMLDDGLTIVSNPLVAVHHSHGLGPINYARQVMAWRRMVSAHQSSFDINSVRSRRPDIDFS